jgi:carbonic anhydrase
MTMHLHHPSLSLGGKKKGKVKFRNAEEARKARELDTSWKELQKKWNVEADEKKRKRAISAESWIPERDNYRGSNVSKIPSKDTGWTACTKLPDKVYTGTNIKGIGTMHKSNAVPIFTDEQAIEISSMRR